MSIRILCGHVLDKLAEIPPESVHCVVTSPPYFGLRDYKIEPQVWLDGWRGSLGLEPTLDLYLDHMVDVCRAIRRVLRKDGTVFLNIGDSYCSSPPGNKTIGVSAKSGLHGVNGASGVYRETLASGTATKRDTTRAAPGLKPKDLMLIPHRLALALQADGWWVRDEIVWAKSNPMPESVTDRCTRAHEFVFMLTKSRRYFYDAEATKEDAAESTLRINSSENVNPRGTGSAWKQDVVGNGHAGLVNGFAKLRDGKRNKRSVWTLATQPFPDAHFATYPPALVEPCILAGTSAKGVCPKCGAPWVRVVEREARPNIGLGVHTEVGGRPHRNPGGGVGADRRKAYDVGWAPTCRCDASEPAPAMVLDPFGGSGTTGIVADRLGRNAILIDLNPEYAEMARRRIEKDAPLFTEVAAE